MAKPDLSKAPDVPAFRPDEVHRMQAELLKHAEQLLGPRSHAYTIAPARFSSSATEASATRIGHEIAIELDINAAGDWQCCVALLGHELVHALDGLTGQPSWLEEGIACAFGLGHSAAWFDTPSPLHLCTGRYREALEIVAKIPNQFEVVHALRAQGIRLCRVTAQQLMAAAPGIGADVATSLCRPFAPAPMVIGRSVICRRKTASAVPEARRLD